MSALKDVIYISNEDYETLVTTGTVVIGGETLTYDENSLYITPDEIATTSSPGLMPALNSSSVATQSQSTKFLREDGTWAAPSYTSQDGNTWRKVQLGGVDKLGNATTTNPFNIVAGDNMSITESNGTFTFTSTGIFWATYGTTTGEEIAAAITAGKYVCCKYNNSIYGNVMLHSSEARYYLTGLYGSYTRRAVRCSQTGATWSTSDTTFMDYFQVDNVSISTHQKINTINANYNASTNKLATASDLPTKTSDLTNDSNFEVTTNKTGILSSQSTSTQYPNAEIVYQSIQNVMEVAEGRTKTFVTQLASYTQSGENSPRLYILAGESGTAKQVGDSIAYTTSGIGHYEITDGTTDLDFSEFDEWYCIEYKSGAGNNTIYEITYIFYAGGGWSGPDDSGGDVHIGDNLLITNTEVPDYWFTDTSGLYLSQLETAKIDLSDYVKVDTEQNISGTKILNNNVYLKGRTTAVNNNTSTYRLVGLNASNEVSVGDTSTTIRLNGPSVSSSSIIPYGDSYDLGNSYGKWKNLYLSGNLTDGTNSITVANIVAKQNALPTTTTAGQVLKSTSTAGSVEWGTISIPTVNNASHIIQLNGTTIGTNFTANASSNITTNIQALPNYSLSISTSAGNPREVKFVRVNYTDFTSNYAAYFKIGAMCSHGNGSSYTFLEDIIIGVTSLGDVTCTVYKQVQNTSTFTVDEHTVHFGDVYWVVDTTDKYVDFFIICGQYATMNFTPFTAIGSTSKNTSQIVQQTGSATLYSSGTRVWNTLGNGSLYAKTTDIPTKTSQLTNDSGYTSNVGTVTSVNSVSPTNGNVSLTHADIGAGNLTLGDGVNYMLYRTHESYRAGYYYHTTGDESVVFANKYNKAGWIFAVTDPVNRTNWQSLTPSLQIKDGGVAINKLIGQGVTPTYKLDVNGSANATSIYENGTDISTKYYLASNPNGYTTNKGTVTSVSAGTGLSISGTSTVNPTVNIASGYKLPTTTEWSGMAELANGKTKTYATTLVNTGNDIFFPIGSTVLSGVVAKTSLNSACSTADIQMGTSGFDYIDLEQLVGRDWYDDYYLYIWHTVDSTTCSVTSISLGNLNVGDIILLTDLNYPDYWIDDNGGILYKMETTKVDLTDYVTTNTEQTISGTKTFTSTNSYISGCGFSKSDNLLSDTNPAAMRGLGSNPFFGLRCNSTNYYLQATSAGLYLGPTSTVATSWDASGNITIRGTTQPKWGTKTLATTDQLSSYVPTSRTINNKALTADIMLSASDVQALPNTTKYVKSASVSGNTLTLTTTELPVTFTPSFTESDTLATVTGRGATTSSNLTLSGTTDVSGGTLKLKVIKAPTTPSGTTYGTGTGGQVLKSTGSSVYWESDTGKGTKLYLHTILTVNDETVCIISTQSTAFTRTSSYLQVTGKIISCWGYSGKRDAWYFCYPSLFSSSTGTNFYIGSLSTFGDGTSINMISAQSDTVTAL